MKIFLTIVITAIVTWVVAGVFYGLRTGVERLWMVSAMKAPGGMALRDVQANMNAGPYDIAKEKIDALTATWLRFSSGPDSCRGAGIGDIMVTFSKLPSHTSVEPDGPASRSHPVQPESNSPPLPAGSGR
jgi:hypothetical protein